MSSLKSMICTKHFVESQLPEKRKKLLSYLSTSGQDQYQKTPTVQTGAFEDLSLSGLLGKIDPSHFVNVLSPLAHETKIAYLSALSPHIRNEVANFLSIKDSFYEYEPKLREDFLQKILSLLCAGQSPILPFSYFPDDPLLFLVKADGIELSTLCCFLGLFDLIEEIPKVIDGKLLVKLEEALSPDEISVLQEIGRMRGEKVHFEEIGLRHWNGDVSLLRGVLKERGINRLAKALSHSFGDLIWLVEQIMDARMKIEFQRYRIEMGDRKQVDLLIKQVRFCWEKICTHSH